MRRSQGGKLLPKLLLGEMRLPHDCTQSPHGNLMFSIGYNDRKRLATRDFPIFCMTPFLGYKNKALANEGGCHLS